MSLNRPTLAAVVEFRGWRALRHRNYRLFFSGQLVSLIGTWMQSVAQGWLVLQITGDPIYLGIVAAFQFGPVLLFGLFGGLVADGLPKRKTLIVTQTSAMILAFILFGLAATHTVRIEHVLILSILLGITNAVDMPTRQAFAVEMVGRDDIGNAVALNSAVFNGARVVGPAIAGLTIGATGVAAAFLINGLSFLGVIVAYIRMKEEHLQSPPRLARPANITEVREHLAAGLSYVKVTPAVLVPILVIGLVSTFGMNFNVIIPPLAKDILGIGPTGYGFLMASTGIGSLIAALVIAFGRRSRVMIIGIGAVVLGVAELVLAVSGSYALSLIAMFFTGLGAISMAATANTTIQLTVPDQLRGRVMSVYTTVFAGSTPIGGLLAGGLASAVSVPFSIAVGAALSLIVGVGTTAWYWRERSRARTQLVGSTAASLSGQAGTAAAASPAGARRSTGRG